jgi:hypothetical protein
MMKRWRKEQLPIIGRLVGALLNRRPNDQCRPVFELAAAMVIGLLVCTRGQGQQGKSFAPTPISTRRKPSNTKAQPVYGTGLILGRNGPGGFAQTEGLFDICYNDVDKGDYPESGKWPKTDPSRRPILPTMCFGAAVAVENLMIFSPAGLRPLWNCELIFNDPSLTLSSIQPEIA